MDKLYPFSELRKRMKEAGLPSSKPTLYRWENQGRLTLKRLPGWQGKKQQRIVTEKDIEGIIKAFSPGGSGEYHSSV